MEWWLGLPIILGGLVLVMVSGLPVAFCFMLVNLIGAYLFWGGQAGLLQLTHSIFASVSTFTLLPVPLFILMGEVMYQSGMAPKMIDAVDKWLGRLPGRLGLLAVSSGTILATLSGASMASVAMLGSVLVPEMETRGYKKPMSLGPILGSCGLSIMIPPTNLGIILGAIAEISVGKILIAIIIPGLIMAALYAIYIIGRCVLQPSVAPAYDVPPIPISEKVVAAVRHILPLGLIVFLVTGLIFVGVATPTEAAAAGAIGTFILTAAYRRLNWKVVKKSVGSTLEITVMVFMIMAGAKAFSQILVFSGATGGLVEFTVGLPLPSMCIIITMLVVLVFLGMFMSSVPVMMITLPIFMPVIYALGFEPVWFAVLFLLTSEMATTSPPFGMSLFVMKGVAPADTTMGDIYRAALPFLYCDLVAMALIIAFPLIALWLPGLMR